MTTSVNVVLVGADSYATLTKVYSRGVVFQVSREEWSQLSQDTHPVTGAPMFAESTTAPVPKEDSTGEITITSEAPAEKSAKGAHKAVPSRFVKHPKATDGTTDTGGGEAVVSL